MPGVLRPLVLAGVLVAAFAAPASAAGWLPAVDVFVPTSSLDGAGQDSIVASDAAGESFATWSVSDGANRRIMLAAHLPGRPWSAPTLLTAAGHNAYAPALSLSTTGFGAIALTHADGTKYRIDVSRRVPGSDFGAPSIVSATGVNAGSPVVGVDRAGDIEVAWIGESDVVHARRFDAVSASWSPTIDDLTPSVAVPANQHLEFLTLVMSPSGNTTAAWAFDTNPTGRDAGTGDPGNGTESGTADFNVQSRTQDASGTWLPMAQATTTTSPEISTRPQLAVADDGTVTLVWMDYTAADVPCGLTLNRDCFTYVTATVRARTRSPTGPWGSPETLSPAGVTSHSPTVAAAPGGETTVAWWDGAAGTVKVLTRTAGGVFPAASAATSITPQDSEILPAWVFGGPASSLQLTAATLGTVATFALADDQGHYRASAVFRPAGGPWPDPSAGLATLEPPSSDSGTDVTAGIDGLGNVVTVWTRAFFTYSGPGVVQSAALDVSPPAFTAVDVPSTGTTGQLLTMSATTVDVWSVLDPGSTGWSFGDGSTATGTFVSHAFSAPGIYTVTIGANDPAGNVAPPLLRQIVISNAIPPLPTTTVTTPKARITWKAGKLRNSTLTLSGTVGEPGNLTITMLRHGTAKTAAERTFAAAAGAWSTALKLPARLMPGLYDITVSGPLVQSSRTSFTLAAPASGRIRRTFATGRRRGPSITTLVRSSELWAHFSFSTLPRRGHRITTRWILPSGKKLAADPRPRSWLVEAHVTDLSGKALPAGRWRCVLEVGNVVLATVSVRLR